MTTRRQTIAVPRPTSFERSSPYARRIAQKAVEAVPTPRIWPSRAGIIARSVSPPLTSLVAITPRLAPTLQSSAPAPITINMKKTSHHAAMVGDADMQNRLQKLSSKRDRQKQAKEDDYALDPALVQVAPQHACARCKSQKWKCYILADPSSPRRTCLPCGKNKCTFGGSKNRPPTLAPVGGAVDAVMAVQRPRLMHNPGYDHAHHSHSHSYSRPAQPRSHGFSHHRSNSGHMHSHPPPLHIQPLASPFQSASPALPTPELSPSSLTEAFPSPDPRTPVNGYFFRAERDDHGQDRDARLRHSTGSSYEYENDGGDVEATFDLDLERTLSPHSTEYHPAAPWHAQGVIHLIPSERLRPIPLPSPAEILSREGSVGRTGAALSAPGSPALRRLSSPLSSPSTSPRHHAHFSSAPAQCPSSPHCPPSPLFPPSPKMSNTHRHSFPSLTLPPMRSNPIAIPRANSMSVSSLAHSSLPSLGSSPSLAASSSSFEPPPPTNALLSLLIESATRAPNDPRPLLVANDMLGVSDQWVSQINAARRYAGSHHVARDTNDYDAYKQSPRFSSNYRL